MGINITDVIEQTKSTLAIQKRKYSVRDVELYAEAYILFDPKKIDSKIPGPTLNRIGDLLEQGASPFLRANQTSMSAVDGAVLFGILPLIDLYHLHKVNFNDPRSINECGRSLLMVAIDQEHEHAIGRLIAYGSDVNYTNKDKTNYFYGEPVLAHAIKTLSQRPQSTPMMLAKQARIIKELLDAGAKPDTGNEYILNAMEICRHPDIIHLLYTYANSQSAQRQLSEKPSSQPMRRLKVGL